MSGRLGKNLQRLLFDVRIVLVQFGREEAEGVCAGLGGEEGACYVVVEVARGGSGSCVGGTVES